MERMGGKTTKEIVGFVTVDHRSNAEIFRSFRPARRFAPCLRNDSGLHRDKDTAKQQKTTSDPTRATLKRSSNNNNNKDVEHWRLIFFFLFDL